ncbi:hypothetical protein [Sandarakinorhabdus sp. DWP1-3-1]|uniref:hypothetical protein n=1 Tax=Sandarakinorhabdus sp. DWP1-3-1 TaxID=2804627 RepID=UPI003CF0109F
MRTITAMFDSRADAEAARDRLARAGISDADVAIHDKRCLDGGQSRSTADSHDADGAEGRTGGFSDVERPAGGVYGADYRTTTDYPGDVGLRQREASAETDSAPMHRNALGDFVDSRTGKNVADKEDGLHRNAIGDFVDDRTGKNVADKEDGLHRNAIGDFVDDQGHRVGDDEDAHRDHDHRGAWDKIASFFTGDSHVYEEGMRRGGHLLTVHVADGDVDRATEILDEDGVVDLDERQASWRNQGWGDGVSDVSATGRPRVRSYDRD